jgi:hypothetical protein
MRSRFPEMLENTHYPHLGIGKIDRDRDEILAARKSVEALV